MSVFSFGDSPPHTPNEEYIYNWDSDNTSNDNRDDFEPDKEDSSLDESDHLDCDADKDDISLDEDDRVDYYDDDHGGDNDDSLDESDHLDCDADKDDISLDEDDRLDYFDDENEDPFINCRVCNKPISSSFLNEHLNNQHKCNYCVDCGYMNADSLEAHINEKHTVACKHCDAKELFNEIAQHELSHPTVGMIQLNQLSNERFNQLVAENRIYALEGSLFVKEESTLSEQLSKIDLN